MKLLLASCAVLVVLGAQVPAFAGETITLAPVDVTDWKAVYGQIEPRDRIPARARIGGTLVELSVTEGDMVTQGQPLAKIVDDKLGFQLSALQAQRAGVQAQLDNAKAELKRGQELVNQGVTTAQHLDALQTQVDVFTGQLAALDSQAAVITESQNEGSVLAPSAGRVLDVPVSKGAVLMPGEEVALLSVGATFLRLSVPERHAPDLHEGDPIRIEGAGMSADGKLAKVYPLIESGRVMADVEVQGLPDRFVDARVLVRLPVGHHSALMVPEAAVATQGGLDFVAVERASGPVMRAVVPGVHQDGMVEVLSGLEAGDQVLTVAPAPGAGQ